LYDPWSTTQLSGSQVILIQYSDLLEDICHAIFDPLVDSDQLLSIHLQRIDKVHSSNESIVFVDPVNI
jgi:hypothetical protein